MGLDIDQLYDHQPREWANRRKGYEKRLKDQKEVLEFLTVRAAVIVVNHSGFASRGVQVSDFIPWVKEQQKRTTVERRKEIGEEMNRINWDRLTKITKKKHGIIS